MDEGLWSLTMSVTLTTDRLVTTVLLSTEERVLTLEVLSI